MTVVQIQRVACERLALAAEAGTGWPD